MTLNGAETKPNTRLHAGDEIVLQEPEPEPAAAQPEEIPIHVLYEDEDLIVVNKDPGMVVHPAAGNWEGTLVNALLHHCTDLSGVGGAKRPGIVHRLDKETSGCLVAAKNDFAHGHLARQFAGRFVTKIYLALAAGRFQRGSGSVNAAILRHAVQRHKMAVNTKGQGRQAVTDYKVLAEFPWAEALHATASLVQCTLHTGRTHQIRVHLKHLGHPLLGDEVYGRRLGCSRQMLHAWKLGFTHPRTGEAVACVAPIPGDFPREVREYLAQMAE